MKCVFFAMLSLQFVHFCLHLSLPQANNEYSKITKFCHIQEIMFTGCGQEHRSGHFLKALAVIFHYYWKPFGVILKESRGISRLDPSVNYSVASR